MNSLDKIGNLAQLIIIKIPELSRNLNQAQMASDPESSLFIPKICQPQGLATPAAQAQLTLIEDSLW